MIFKQDEILVVPSIDLPNIFYVLRGRGPDAVIKVDSKNWYLVKGPLTPEEIKFININLFL